MRFPPRTSPLLSCRPKLLGKGGRHISTVRFSGRWKARKREEDLTIKLCHNISGARSPETPETRPPLVIPSIWRYRPSWPSPISLQFNLLRPLHLTQSQIPIPPRPQTLPRTLDLTRLALWPDTETDGKGTVNPFEKEFGSHELPRQRYATISRHTPCWVRPNPHPPALPTVEKLEENQPQTRCPTSLDPTAMLHLDGQVLEPGPTNYLFRSFFCLVDGGTLQPVCCKLITSSDQQFLMRPHGLPPLLTVAWWTAAEH